MHTREGHASDLTEATLIGTNLAAAILEQAILDGVSGTDQVSGATVNLSGAFLSSASLRKATLSQGKLYGATLLDADLEGADLGGAFLSNCNDASCSPKVPSAASLGGAHLKNVNLAKADLSGADFSTASFYSSSLAGTGKCTFSNGNCATAAGATMNNTQFNQAYLVGVDFTGAQVQGVQFDGAVLIGANFGGATLAVDPTVGTNSGFQNAFLQGTQLGGAMLTGTSLANAFLDFRAGGNDMFLHLSDVYADFPNWHAPKHPICAFRADREFDTHLSQYRYGASERVR
ncbi:MAG: pentapeptide repeat-containing protein [bacterium]